MNSSMSTTEVFAQRFANKESLYVYMDEHMVSTCHPFLTFGCHRE